MSGSGGFYKYPCKNYLTYNCTNWVYCNGHACAMCLAEGKDGETTPAVETQLGSPSPHVVIAIDTFGGPSLKVPFVGYNSGLGGVGGEDGFGFEKSEILDDDDGVGDGEAAPVPVQELPRPR